jgi:hypothetical protein
MFANQEAVKIMSITMNNKNLQAMANELAKDVKIPEDLNNLSAFLTKLTVEAALKVEMDHHLGYDKSDPTGYHSGNSLNGFSTKKLKGDHGEVQIETPRDRNASFVPQLINNFKECLSNVITDEAGTEIVSIMFEMKNEDFIKELDKDRTEKGCEYAVLVSLLEPDSELYNSGIVDVFHRCPRMYIVRPQLFY